MGGIAMIVREPNASQKRVLSIVHSSANQMQQLINDLLDMSKLSAEKLTLLPVATNVIKIVKEAIGMLVPMAKEKKLETYIQIQADKAVLCSDSTGEKGILTFAKPGHDVSETKVAHEPIPGLLLIDRTRLLQVLSNLLTNAFKFTSSGHILTSVWFHKDDTDPRLWNVAISVKDTGIGITDEQIKHINRMKQRELLDLTEPVPMGSAVFPSQLPIQRFANWGLGLQISHHIIGQMGGTLVAASEGHQRGATFTIRFAAQEVFDEIPPSEQMEPSTILDADYMPTIDLSGHFLLIADDDLVNQLILQQILQELFHATCDIANDGQVAVELVKQKGMGHYTVILMDLLMPNLPGDEAAVQLHDLGCCVPIVAISGNMRNESQLASQELFADHLDKPISIHRLGATLEKLVPKSCFITKRKKTAAVNA